MSCSGRHAHLSKDTDPGCSGKKPAPAASPTGGVPFAKSRSGEKPTPAALWQHGPVKLRSFSCKQPAPAGLSAPPARRALRHLPLAWAFRRPSGARSAPASLPAFRQMLVPGGLLRHRLCSGKLRHPGCPGKLRHPGCSGTLRHTPGPGSLLRHKPCSGKLWRQGCSGKL